MKYSVSQDIQESAPEASQPMFRGGALAVGVLTSQPTVEGGALKDVVVAGLLLLVNQPNDGGGAPGHDDDERVVATAPGSEAAVLPSTSVRTTTICTALLDFVLSVP